MSQPSPTSLLVEGWRGVNHSFALVNQHQILELLKLPGLQLYHRDLPFAFGHWNRTINSDGFSPEDRARIDSLHEPGDTACDCVYRICSPLRAGLESDRRRTLTFMITEIGLAASSFVAGADRAVFFGRDDNLIVTSTRWSRDRIIEYGLSSERVRVIPLGVDDAFHAPTPQERAASRANLGIHDNETVFLNIGVAVWNKGIDVLLRAFAVLRSQGNPIRLILKDQRSLYGISVEQTLQNVGQDCPELLRPDTLSAISVISANLDRTQMRLLYGIADCYVSPYRAEGFNLPVLESIACGTPVIVTRGGATDDFCDDDVAYRIPGRARRRDDAESGLIGQYIEPDPDALLHAMAMFAARRGIDRRRFAAARVRIMEQFSWRRAAQDLAILAAGGDIATADDEESKADAVRPSAPVRQVTQQDVLELIAMVRPRSMERLNKVRIGNEWDGGYVLPENALACDAVVSIGVGSDVSFDIALAERGAQVLQFDNTVECSPVAHRNFRFHQLGWGARSGGNFVSFDDIHAMLAPLGASRKLLKFDIEGAEYDVLPAVNPDHLAEFEVIACEIHDLNRLTDPFFFDRTRRALQVLTQHHAPVHLHANNYRGVVMIHGVPIPEVLEISFLRRDIDILSDFSEAPIPGPLDRPNHPLAPDLYLNAF